MLRNSWVACITGGFSTRSHFHGVGWSNETIWHSRLTGFLRAQRCYSKAPKLKLNVEEHFILVVINVTLLSSSQLETSSNLDSQWQAPLLFWRGGTSPTETRTNQQASDGSLSLSLSPPCWVSYQPSVSALSHNRWVWLQYTRWHHSTTQFLSVKEQPSETSQRTCSHRFRHKEIGHIVATSFQMPSQSPCLI
jgi:hypothetical protein